LINPSPNQTNLFGGQGLCRRAAPSARSAAVESSRAAGCAWSAFATLTRTARRRVRPPTAWRVANTGLTITGASRPSLGRHGDFIVQLCGCRYQKTLLAIAGHNHFAILAAFQHRLQAIEAQPGFRSLFTVTAEALGFEKGANVLGVGDILLVGNWRQLADIHFADITFVLCVEGKPDSYEADKHH